MAVSKNQQKCVNTYIQKHYDRVNLTMEKGKKETIKKFADQNGESLNSFINRAIDKLIEEESKR